MSDLIYNPLKTMSIEELRKKVRLTNDPIVRFACIREEYERIAAECSQKPSIMYGNAGGLEFARNRLNCPA